MHGDYGQLIRISSSLRRVAFSVLGLALSVGCIVAGVCISEGGAA